MKLLVFVLYIFKSEFLAWIFWQSGKLQIVGSVSIVSAYKGALMNFHTFLNWMVISKTRESGESIHRMKHYFFFHNNVQQGYKIDLKF